VFEVGGGFISKIRWQRSSGALFDLPFTTEEMISRWTEITQFEKNFDFPTSSADTFNRMNENFDRLETLRE